MNGFEDFLQWLVLSVPVICTPGPVHLLLLASGGVNGVVRTLPMIFGLLSAMVIYHLALELGLFYLFDHFRMGFLIVQLGGVTYVLYLSYQLFFTEVPKYQPERVPTIDVTFWRGLLLNLSNVKLIGFMLTVGTQFVDHRASMTYEIISLIVADVGLLFVTYVIWAYAGSHVSSPRSQRQQNVVFAMLLLGMGLWMFANVVTFVFES